VRIGTPLCLEVQYTQDTNGFSDVFSI